MEILVLGGSYFLGKCFVQMAKDNHHVTVLNRGTNPLNLPTVKEVCGDRHDSFTWEQIKDKAFDVVVDFCAYQQGDISFAFESLSMKFKQYIFVSTADVYARGRNAFLDETAPFENRQLGGMEGDYISGKVALERELSGLCDKGDVTYTSIRPAFIYGPDNYAPREGIFFHWIEQAGQIIYPSDATGQFQMVYVEDVAKAILRSMGNPHAYNQAFNLTPPKMETYDSFAKALQECYEKPFEKLPVTVSQILEKNIPLPFPLTQEESNFYDGKKALCLIDAYTILSDGLKKTVFHKKQKNEKEEE